MIVNPGSENVTAYFKMRLKASGQAATVLSSTDFDLQYTRSGSAPAAKVDATLNPNGVGGAHADNTVIEVDATDSPGLYRIDWPDAAFAAGVPESILTANVATAFSESLRVRLDLGLTITPIGVTVSQGLVSDSHTSVFHNDAQTQTFVINDTDEDPIDMSGKDIVFKVQEHDEQSSDTIFTRSSTDSQISVSGVNNNNVAVTYTSTGTATVGSFRYAMWDTTNMLVVARGNFNVVAVPSSTGHAST